MSSELTIKCPAKVNLFLHITGRRDDGYHNIYTLFYPVSIYDTLNIKKSAKTTLTCLLTHFGGHPLAAGLGIKKEDIPEFRKQINLFARDNYPVMPVQTLKLDCKLSPFYINLDLVDSLVALEPYGAENPEAVFGLFNVNLISVTPVSDGKHVRFEVEKKGKVFKIIQFRRFPLSAMERRRVLFTEENAVSVAEK